MRLRKKLLPLALALTGLGSGSFILPTVQAAAWVTNGPMATARLSHTMTLLPNGKVLVAGGSSDLGGHAIASAELYEPATGAWTPTGTMHAGRYYHTATLLPNGRVLVVGGSAGLASAELYDPATGQWQLTGALSEGRDSHTATLLSNGKVLVAGGYSYSGVLSSAELYDPATGGWTAAGALTAKRWAPTATLLPDGNVLVAGGYGETPEIYLSSAELFDPASGTWTAAGAMLNGRTRHIATLLPTGQVLVAGGHDGWYDSSAELYDPVSRTWAATGSMTSGRFFPTATLLPSGKVLLTAGKSGPTVLSSTELYDPVTGIWTTTASLSSPRYQQAATLLANGEVLVTGGVRSGGTFTTLSSTEVYDSANGTWTSTASLNLAPWQHTVTALPSGKVLVAGGDTNDYVVTFGPTLADAELYDPATSGWTGTGPLNVGRCEHTATLLPSGKVLVTGGYGTCGFVPQTELYDPVSGVWTVRGSLAAVREMHTATLLRNGKVLVAGGYSTNATYLASAELYDPAAGTWTTTGNMNAARYEHTATLLPDGKVLVAGGFNSHNGYLAGAELYDPACGRWVATSPLATGRIAHTANLLPNGKVLIAGGSNNGSPLSSAEIYDPATGTWVTTGPLLTARWFHTATLLQNGMVLAVGGQGAWSPGGIYPISVELYDPATGMWTATGSLNTARYWFGATLLPSGQVLVVGGKGNLGLTASVEVYDVGLGFTNSWRPQIATCSSPLSLGSSLALAGSGFRGVAEGSSGNAQASPTDYPLVQLRSLESGQSMFLLSTNWQTNSFTSAPVWGFPPGYTLATVFVNGIPSTGSVLNINVPVPAVTFLSGAKRLTNGAFQFSFTNSVGALFGVLATTNPALPLSNWTALGGIAEVSPGQFQFADPGATNSEQRFYRIRSP